MTVPVGTEEVGLMARLEKVGMLAMEAEGGQGEGLSKPRKDRTSLVPEAGEWVILLRNSHIQP